MQLHVLLYGKSKKRMHPIMVDELKKCENYRLAREKSGVKGWHDIQLAEVNAATWKQKTATVGGNKCQVNRVGKGPAGYISKRGFQAHT
jgi:hypothetical protein